MFRPQKHISGAKHNRNAIIFHSINIWRNIIELFSLFCCWNTQEYHPAAKPRQCWQDKYVKSITLIATFYKLQFAKTFHKYLVNYYFLVLHFKSVLETVFAKSGKI